MARLQKDLRSHDQRMADKVAFSRSNPSRVDSITDAVTIKRGGPFHLMKPNGATPGGKDHGYGLYFQDCRFLDCLELRLDGQVSTALGASAAEGFAALHLLSNPQLDAPDGPVVQARSLLLELDRTLEETAEPNQAIVHVTLSVKNYSTETVKVTLTLGFNSQFLDVFEVRGLVAPTRALVRRRLVDESTAVLARHSIDGLWRSLAINFLPKPDNLTTSEATYQLCLEPDVPWQLTIGAVASISAKLEAIRSTPKTKAAIEPLREEYRASREEWRRQQTEVETSNPLFDLTLARSLMDLWILRTTLGGDEYIAAGLPWFGTLFGRDSSTTALQTLAFDYTIAEKTLRVLAQYQGTRVDEASDEQPGKILHELRRGPLAGAGRIPSPYYGSVDSTLVFLILAIEHHAWSGDSRLIQELRPQIEAALSWIDNYGDSDGDGFVDYRSPSGAGYLINQGWKDSGDAIVNADGSLATPPIALVEVQGYVYRIKSSLADLFEAQGDVDLAQRLRAEAEQLKQRFNERFWLPKEGIYALALQRGDRPAAVMSSNPGQALWGGIVAAEHAPEVARRLMDETMFSGWGVRTLATTERRYNPISYHLGTVWPHDNSLIAAGLRRYGFDAAAQQIFSGIFAAATHFTHYRLPELLSGYSRKAFSSPAHYPVACHPQAWAAGSVPYLLQTTLGLAPDASHGTLRICHPDLPEWLERVELRRLRVGASTVDLRFVRAGARTHAEVIHQDGPLKVLVDEPRREARRAQASG